MAKIGPAPKEPLGNQTGKRELIIFLAWATAKLYNSFSCFLSKDGDEWT